MLPGVDAVYAGCHYADSGQSAVQGGTVGDAVGAKSHAADDAGLDRGIGHGSHQFLAPERAVGADVPRAHEANHGPEAEYFRGGGGGVDVQTQRRGIAIPQRLRVILVQQGKEAPAALVKTGKFPARPLQGLRRELGHQLRVWRWPIGVGHDGGEQLHSPAGLLHQCYGQVGMVSKNVV